jgi:hypothetical protein
MGWFSDVTGGIFDPISDPLADAEDTVRNELAGLDDFINENIPGGWGGVILVAGGVYYAPEIGAFFSSSGAPLTAAEASTAVTAETAAAGSSGTGLTAGGSGVGLTGGNTANLGAMGGGQGLTGASTAGTTVGATGGALSYGGLGSNLGVTLASLTPSQLAGLKASGMSLVDYVKAGLLVNSLTGDPLGLGGEQPSGGGGQARFDIVPVPTSWKSPTYAKSSKPIDLESIFTTKNLLGGTQWQGSVNQKPNITFNDIFASGQQSTPMGTPVDINQIVSAILGQNAASQKST